jgi:hypothetical protein
MRDATEFPEPQRTCVPRLSRPPSHPSGARMAAAAAGLICMTRHHIAPTLVTTRVIITSYRTLVTTCVLGTEHLSHPERKREGAAAGSQIDGGGKQGCAAAAVRGAFTRENEH